MWIKYAYGIAALFEVVGVLFVVADVRHDRRLAREVVTERRNLPRSPGRRAWVHEQTGGQRRGPHSGESYRMLKRRRERTYAVVHHVERRAAHAEAEILNMLRGRLGRRLGPLFLIVGIVIGTVANIANTH